MAHGDQLMQDFRAGREPAFNHFMRQHLRALTFHAYQLCRSKEVAEDIVSETFTKLWQAKANFETETNIKAFLYITARNACLDYVRSAQRRRGSQQDELDEGLVNPGTDPLTHLIHAELIQSVVEEIARLPERQGEVFRMTYLEGLNTDEICAQLGITPNAVFLARKKAIAAIRKAFAGRDLYLWLALSGLLGDGMVN